ncbi:hypothetical protein L798_10940 [Zootermopsis nevadensis]|uniref:Uncharacterized protein n=1 Tax=Zootermopsis nevadensis TaxID=136037 RepID=A0A067RGV6_ZOONE|nr:hypothetical protein L798_10940 [Zootermopsis nevadensis]
MNCKEEGDRTGPELTFSNKIPNWRRYEWTRDGILAKNKTINRNILVFTPPPLLSNANELL